MSQLALYEVLRSKALVLEIRMAGFGRKATVARNINERLLSEKPAI